MMLVLILKHYWDVFGSSDSPIPRLIDMDKT